jgi:hypothetical protein
MRIMWLSAALLLIINTISLPPNTPQRQSKREGWLARSLDPAFQTVPPDCQPMPVPFPPAPDSTELDPDSEGKSKDEHAACVVHKEPDSLLLIIDRLQTQHEAFLLLNR